MCRIKIPNGVTKERQMGTSSPNNIGVTRHRSRKGSVNYSLNTYLDILFSPFHSRFFSGFPVGQRHSFRFLPPPERSCAYPREKEARKSKDSSNYTGGGRGRQKNGLYSWEYFTRSLERVSRPESRNLSSPLCMNAPLSS